SKYRFFVFFFFQAEDGIRDATVTGVQTCALPISRLGACEAQRRGVRPSCGTSLKRMPVVGWSAQRKIWRLGSPRICTSSCLRTRSEERRVGKEVESLVVGGGTVRCRKW